MAWFLQTPDSESPKLLANIIGECSPSVRGAAAFAFASSGGVKLLIAGEPFQRFLKASEFTVVIGLDAITDMKAVEALKKVKDKYPNFKPKLFLHDTVGSTFHPKTMWLRSAKGGVTITGSGNLTTGGLQSNWEALAVEKLTPDEIDKVEKCWDAWIAAHQKQLLDLDDKKALEKAKANQTRRVRIKKALKLPEDEGAEAEALADAAEEVVEEALQDLKLNPILIAEVPKSKDRWEQVNFDKASFVQFFGVTEGTPKAVKFFHVQHDGSLKAEKERPAVSVKSRNFRFEVGAAKGHAYPKKGLPILVFERIADSIFNYVLLMPGQEQHAIIENFLVNNYPAGRKRRRIPMTSGDLQKIWPDAPFFL